MKDISCTLPHRFFRALGNRRQDRVLLLALSSLLFLAGGMPLAAQEVATIKSLEGDVTIRTAKSPRYRPAAVGDELRIGDFLATDIESEAVLSFPAGADMRVGEMTQMRLNQMFLAEDRSELQVFLRTGEVETLTPEKTLKRTDFSVVTPTCTASIRGTHQLVKHSDGFGTDVKFLKGFGFTRSAMGTVFNQVAGQAVSVDMASQMAGPEQVSRNAAIPDLSPVGRDAVERKVSTGFNRETNVPPADPSSPSALVNKAALEDPARIDFNIQRVR